MWNRGDVMVRLTLFLGAALYLVLLLGGGDGGQQRLGLTGAYDVAHIAVTPIGTAETSGGQAVAGLQAEPAVYAPAQPVMTAPDEALVQSAVALAAPAPAEAAADIRVVSAQAVNVRGGPATSFQVVDRLTRGEEVLVVADAGNGWSLIRIEGDGIEGYISTRLLSAQGE